MTPISFFVSGEPKGQPRPKAFARKFGEKWMARVYDSGTAENWKSCIAAAAKPHIPKEPIRGPVCVSLKFYFARPKSHYRTGMHADKLKPNAPHWHTQKPDRDNLDKCVLDCLTQLGFWRDDAQVCFGWFAKLWTDTGVGGCEVRIMEEFDDAYAKTGEEDRDAPETDLEALPGFYRVRVN